MKKSDREWITSFGFDAETGKMSSHLTLTPGHSHLMIVADPTDKQIGALKNIADMMNLIEREELTKGSK